MKELTLSKMRKVFNKLPKDMDKPKTIPVSFKINQIIYIQGKYKAKILKFCDNNMAMCKVYEGLPAYDEHKGIYTYSLDLLKHKKLK